MFSNCLFHYFSVIHTSVFSFLQPQDIFMFSNRSLFFWGAVMAPLTSPGTRIWPVFLPLKEQAMSGLAGQWRQLLTSRIHVHFKTAWGTALRVSVLYSLLLSLSWSHIYVGISGSVLHELNFHFPFLNLCSAFWEFSPVHSFVQSLGKKRIKQRGSLMLANNHCMSANHCLLSLSGVPAPLWLGTGMLIRKHHVFIYIWVSAVVLSEGSFRRICLKMLLLKI